MITQEEVKIGNSYLFNNDKVVKADGFIENHIDGVGAILDINEACYYTLDRLSIIPT